MFSHTLKAPRLREGNHRITYLMIRLAGNPWSMLILAAVTFFFWRISHLDLVLALGGFMIGQLDILSNQYQEVSADERQAELQQNLDTRAQTNQELMEKTLSRLTAIEQALKHPNITIL